ncbi:nicotinate phosphoribosyltransferase [Cohnella kolymensis]|uniref:Nicotinate phosphoribosyltransferase n=1 Tax=Cohnella kolymensis TaxID=1590652 RepID=A0ABR5A9C1_9BACL|nr:nicotinate phosphoribosyltransferase [Cohnella kolymensis]KIL37599.1 nicotinate phosphoribosyltransferase [Cohnella kolymensis]
MNEQLALHTDKYQINMMYVHWAQGTDSQRAVFDVYFRKLPFGNGFAVAAGLERVIRYIEQLHFTEEDIAYLRTQEENYPEEFLDALRGYRFSGDIHAVPEGTVVFPNEPILRVQGRIFEVQLLETAILNFVNYQTLVATKAARVKQVAPNDTLLEFGTRRAQEADAAVWGARAAYVAGFDATSNLRVGKMFDIPVSGTHAHAWVQINDSEEEAFRKYAEVLPDQVTLLVDTYDTLKSGVPNAIRIGRELEARGKRMNAIRLDSGDLAYLSKKARKMLDDAGFEYVKIVATNDLDENIILNLKAEGARIDVWGVGTQLITAADQPALGGVYKLVAREKNGYYEPVIKISANPEKVTNPGVKDIYRIIIRETGKAKADYMALPHETDIRNGESIRLFDPVHSYLEEKVTDYDAIPLLKTIFKAGELVYQLPTLEEIRQYHQDQLKAFWPEYLRKLNPEGYRVHLSAELWKLKMELIRKYQF